MTERDVIVQLVRRLGGSATIAGELNRQPQAIRKWWILGRVPWMWRQKIRKMASEQGLELTEEEEFVLSLEPERQAS
jgi:hypothetical protein